MLSCSGDIVSFHTRFEQLPVSLHRQRGSLASIRTPFASHLILVSIPFSSSLQIYFFHFHSFCLSSQALHQLKTSPYLLHITELHIQDLNSFEITWLVLNVSILLSSNIHIYLWLVGCEVSICSFALAIATIRRGFKSAHKVVRLMNIQPKTHITFPLYFQSSLLIVNQIYLALQISDFKPLLFK